MVVDSILTANGNLMVYFGTKGREIAIQSSPDVIRVSITSSNTVTLTLPSSYKTYVRGLCGNYNDDAADDLLLADGSSVPDGVDVQKRNALIAQSYLTRYVLRHGL